VKELEPVGTAQGNLVALLPAQGGALLLLLQPDQHIQQIIESRIGTGGVAYPDPNTEPNVFGLTWDT
jgi:hypothetical protein